MSSKLEGWALNCRLPRGGSERGSWQVDHAVRILYDIDVEQVSGMNLKLSSAKRVETEVHHLSAYHLPCSCAFKTCSVLAVMQSQLIFCLFLCGSARQNAEEDDSKKSMTLISRLVILKKILGNLCESFRSRFLFYQSCTSSMLILRKEIYPRKFFTNLYWLIF